MDKKYAQYYLDNIAKCKVTTEYDLSEYPKLVLPVAPHTSWKDFPLGLAVRTVLGENIGFMAKKSLFKPPLGGLMKSLGGYEVDRQGGQRQVYAMVEVLKAHDEIKVSIAPEGTRGRVNRLKTGFYHMSRLAEVPIGLVKFDIGNGEVYFKEPFMPTDQEKDMEMITEFYDGVIGYEPENSFFKKDEGNL